MKNPEYENLKNELDLFQGMFVKIGTKQLQSL